MKIEFLIWRYPVHLDLSFYFKYVQSSIKNKIQSLNLVVIEFEPVDDHPALYPDKDVYNDVCNGIKRVQLGIYYWCNEMWHKQITS